MILWKLFYAFFTIGLFSIGGGYAIIPMIRDQVVMQNHWLSVQEFRDIITISQMTPGPLAVNTSTFVGMRVAGIPGALCATIGCICMGVCIAYGIYHIFQRFASSRIFIEILKGLKAGSLGLIMSAAAIILSLAFFKNGKAALTSLQLSAIVIFLIVLIIERRWKVNPVTLILFSGLLGSLVYA
mgnify:FL=1